MKFSWFADSVTKIWGKSPKGVDFLPDIWYFKGRDSSLDLCFQTAFALINEALIKGDAHYHDCWKQSHYWMATHCTDVECKCPRATHQGWENLPHDRRWEEITFSFHWVYHPLNDHSHRATEDSARNVERVTDPGPTKTCTSTSAQKKGDLTHAWHLKK